MLRSLLRRTRTAPESVQPTPKDMPEDRDFSRWDDSPAASLDAAWAALDGLSYVLSSPEAEAALAGLEGPLTRASLAEMVFALLIVTEGLIREWNGTDEPRTC